MKKTIWGLHQKDKRFQVSLKIVFDLTSLYLSIYLAPRLRWSSAHVTSRGRYFPGITHR